MVYVRAGGPYSGLWHHAGILRLTLQGLDSRLSRDWTHACPGTGLTPVKPYCYQEYSLCLGNSIRALTIRELPICASNIGQGMVIYFYGKMLRRDMY